MCHNKETSLVIFIFSIAVVIHFILEYTKTKDTKYIFLSLYLFGLAIMQFVEFLIYYYKFKSNFASWLVLFAIMFQFIIVEIYIHYNKIFPVETCVLDIVFYLVIFGLIIMIKGKPIRDTMNCGHPYLWLGCKLNWGILDNMLEVGTYLTYIAMTIYSVYICAATYELFTPVVFGLFIALYFVTMFFPKVIGMYKGEKIKNFNGSSSAWCFFVVILMSLVIMLDEQNVIK